ncbi:MAG: serine hydrolase [Lachnospiraceae bacterium]|nr:serine hydrolase [Lachnospiraceae bacterium]
MNQKLTARLHAIVERALPKEYTSVSYCIMIDGEIVCADVFGTRNLHPPKKGEEREKATLRMTYNVASVSKIYLAVAVMQLAERGLLDLDTPVYRYLPRFTMPLDSRYKKITLRHCLSHTSGLPGTQWRGFSVTDTEDESYEDDVYEYLSKSTLKAAPGTYAVYCNDGFTLAEFAVSEVTGMSYADYCLKNITEPIGARSTRMAGSYNEAYPMISEKEKPAEQLLIRGGAGITTNMKDLCRFGNLFLEKNPVISEKSKYEMRKRQGRTFLKSDTRTSLYGLGWDQVSFSDPEMDLGEHVLLKGGNSFQFDTQFLVIPAYRAVLAMSETHDCRLDVNGMLLRLFATVMMERGVNLYRRYKRIPADTKRRYEGIYLIPSGRLRFSAEGAVADITYENARGEKERVYKDLWWDGKCFHGSENREFFLEKQGSDLYLMQRFRGRVFGEAMKARHFVSGGRAWKERVGKDYVVCNTDATDYVIHELMSGVRIAQIKGLRGVYVLSFSGKAESGVYGCFDASVRVLNDDRGKGFLRTPANPSRDLVDPVFFRKGKTEYLDAASYRYREASTLPVWKGQPFPKKRRANGVYRITKKLARLPRIPKGCRIMVLDENMICVYDSLFPEKYQPVEKGYLLLIR